MKNTPEKTEYNRLYRERNRERLKIWAREYRVKNGSTRDYKKQRETLDAWNKKYPERRKAHAAVFRAIKKGTLKKQSCEVCGVKRAHAHHEDYTKPLEVIWLCQIHHYEYDMKMKST